MNKIKQQYEENKISWQLSFLDGFCQDENGAPLPWMTYNFIQYLKKNLTAQDVVFEFGCGSSTLFFANRVKKVVALETRGKWLEIMQEKIKALNLKNVELILMENGLENENYATMAKNLAAKGVYFDLVVVDSIKRSNCAQESINALKPGGKLILDDSQRSNYGKIFEFMKQHGFQSQNFEGIEPGGLKIKKSTIFYQ